MSPAYGAGPPDRMPSVQRSDVLGHIGIVGHYAGSRWTGMWGSGEGAPATGRKERQVD